MSPRKRVRADNLPAHIDLRDIPTGVYWDQTGRGRWFVFIKRNGKKARETIAPPDARASELHRIVEERAGHSAGTIAHLMREFHDSTKFAELSERTKKDYTQYRRAIEAHKIKAGALGDMRLNGLTPPWFRRLFDTLSSTPSKANHWARYLKRVFSWGVEWGLCRSNPLSAVRLLKEKGDPKMPSAETHAAFVASLGGWLKAACELTYLCRLRRVEVVGLTDAHATAVGVVSSRRKGSRSTLTRWSPRLREAWDLAIQERDKRWETQKLAIPLRPEDRPLFPGRHTGSMTADGFSTAFDRAMQSFVEKGGQRFSIHGLKHRGITDSTDKRAGGHRTEAMRQRYDHELHAFDAPGITEGSTEAGKPASKTRRK